MGPDDLLGTAVDVESLEGVVQSSGPDVDRILERAVQDGGGVGVATTERVI